VYDIVKTIRKYCEYEYRYNDNGTLRTDSVVLPKVRALKEFAELLKIRKQDIVSVTIRRELTRYYAMPLETYLNATETVLLREEAIKRNEKFY